ncbi:hypothetical protein BLNAU_3927 [Blattamonas nauphoetae]|uniref:Uncharacterized protein n=1 Tax=Blattamonas nauphoetae TaxID=2049346 RepID=A0ABQ9YC30_9EUKA|nr:hypothetical protein BLNAU_3927 [Blattamonas nauphoetae]
MELRADEHDADVVLELVKWEVRMMVEMENEDDFQIVFENMLDKTQEWNQNIPERQKRREVLLGEEGWDDVFELRVVGIEVDTTEEMKECTRRFRVEQGFNTDEMSEHGEMRRNDRRVILVGIVGLEWTESSDDIADAERDTQTLSPSRVHPLPLPHSLPNQPQLRLTTPPSRHPPPLTQPALRRLDRLSPIFTCGTRGGRFVGSDSESEMTLSVDEALVVFCSLCAQVTSESRALG